MSREKENRDKDLTTKAIILVTVIIQLISAIVSLIDKLIE
nr:MAG TPA: hypothetical protein [Caudoviricetes sp.]